MCNLGVVGERWGRRGAIGRTLGLGGLLVLGLPWLRLESKRLCNIRGQSDMNYEGESIFKSGRLLRT